MPAMRFGVSLGRKGYFMAGRVKMVSGRLVTNLLMVVDFRNIRDWMTHLNENPGKV